MKKFTLVFIVFLLFFIPLSTLATSGACSWHGGVNCLRGWQPSGKVYCNDGWLESSTYYTYTEKCKNQDYCWYTKLYLLDKYNELWAKYDITAKENKVTEINQNIMDLNIQFLSDYEKIQDQCIGMIIINRQLIQLNKDYEFELSLLELTKSTYENDYNMSYELFWRECHAIGADEYSQKQYDNLTQSTSCPINSNRSDDGNCYCDLGYQLNSAKDGCVKILCSANAYLNGNSCICVDGYIMKNNICISHTENCQSKYGQFSYGDKDYCYCMDNYKWNDDKTGCIKSSPCVDMINGYFGSDDKCYCNAGFIWNEALNKCIAKKSCPENSYFSSDGECQCYSSHKWNNDKTECLNIAEEFVKKEQEYIVGVDENLSNKLKGKILLQVEQDGEGWYVNPEDQKKYYLGRPADAFRIMRELGLGISESSYDAFHEYAPGRLSGKILLRVEASGEAYYVNPTDLKMHYLGRPADAFQVMRELGLGITNSDIRKIDVGEI